VTAAARINLALVVTIFLWGGMFVSYAYMLSSISATDIIAIRFVLVSVSFLVVFAFVKKLRPRIPKEKYKVLLALGVLGIPGSQLPAIEAQNYLSPSLASVLVTTSPAFAAIFSAWLLREKLLKVQIGGFVVAFSGAFIVIIAGSGTGELAVDNPWGAALCLLSPFIWAIFNVIYKRELGDLEPFSTIGVCLIIGAIAMLPFYPQAARSLDELSVSQWGWMIYSVMGGTIFSYYLWYWALQRLEANKTMAYSYAIPFSALLWAWAIMGDLPVPWAAFGGVILIFGVYLTQKSPIDSKVES